MHIASSNLSDLVTLLNYIILAANLYSENESAWHWYIPILLKNQAWQKIST